MHHPGKEYDPADGDPPFICGGEYTYTIKEVVLDADVAIREVARLNSLTEIEHVRYFFGGTRVFFDGGSFGEGPPR